MSDDNDEPRPMDWAKAQATDLYETGKLMVGLNEPTDRGGTYEPFKNTKAVRERAIEAEKRKNLEKQKREADQSRPMSPSTRLRDVNP